MRLNCIMTLLVAVGVVVMVAAPAEGAIATNMLWADGQTINELEDVDYENLDEPDPGNGKVDVGDVLYGMWEASSVFNVSTTESRTPGDTGNDYFAAVFALEVLEKKTQSDGGVVWGFGPTDDATFEALTDPSGVKTDRSNPNTMIQVWSDADGIASPVGDTDDISGTQLWEWGFDPGSTPLSYYDDTKDDLGMSSLSRFWIGEGSTDDFTAQNIGVGYMAALSNLVTHAGIGLMDHNHLGGTGQVFGDLSFPATGAEAQIHLFGTDQGRIGPAALPLKTDTDMYIKHLHEPASLLVWGVLAIGMLLTGWRRSRRR